MLSTLYQTANDVYHYTETDKAIKHFETMELNQYQSCVLTELKDGILNKEWERYGKYEF